MEDSKNEVVGEHPTDNQKDQKKETVRHPKTKKTVVKKTDGSIAESQNKTSSGSATSSRPRRITIKTKAAANPDKPVQKTIPVSATSNTDANEVAIESKSEKVDLKAETKPIRQKDVKVTAKVKRNIQLDSKDGKKKILPSPESTSVDKAKTKSISMKEKPGSDKSKKEKIKVVKKKAEKVEEKVDKLKLKVKKAKRKDVKKSKLKILKEKLMKAFEKLKRINKKVKKAKK